MHAAMITYTMQRFRWLFVTMLTMMWGCFDLQFDEPPVIGLPDIQANTTIAALKALHTTGEPDRRIEEDIIIGGVVIADDRSGNFFRQIVIQDASGGIAVRVNSPALYNNFPIGREVFVRCLGLFLGDFNGLHQLNGSPGAGLEEVLIRQHIFGGLRDQFVTPDTLSIDQLNAERVNTLVHIRDLQFVNADTGKVFADAPNRQSINRALEDCSNRGIILRSSGFADFASQLTPGGKGGVTAVLSIFGSTRQLLIRDLDDLNLRGERCGTPVSGREDRIPIRELRELYAGGGRMVPANRKIRGVVISDKDHGNIDGRNIVLQDESAGIVVRLEDLHNYALGVEVEVVVSGEELSEFQGLLQVNRVANRQVTAIGQGTLPTPRVATVAQINANFNDWESTLVRIEGVMLSGQNVYQGELNLSDGTGRIALFTRNAATFANTAPPTQMVDVVAIVSQFSAPQLILRNLDDVAPRGGPGPDPGGGPLSELFEDFNSQIDRQDVNLPGWRNLSIKGNRKWITREFQNNRYAQATAFGDESREMETWLITPPLDVNQPSILSFRSAQSFYEHLGLSVWISKDFDGNNFAGATWTELNCRIAGRDDGQNMWIDSGDIDLSAFDGVVHIGFRYLGNNSNQTTTYRVDEVRLRKR
jgi:hypothetical protein